MPARRRTAPRPCFRFVFTKLYIFLYNFKYTGCQIFNRELILHKQLNYFPISEIWDTLLRESKLYGYEHIGEFKHLTDYEIYEKLFI